MDDTHLTIDEQNEFEELWCKIEKYTFVILFILISTFSLGLLDMQRKLALLGQPLTISYQEFVRYRGSDSFMFKIDKPLQSDALHIVVDNEFKKSNELSSITPRAAQESATPDGTEYIFLLDSSQMGTIEFNTKPIEAGLHRLTLIVNGEAISIWQFTWP